MIRSTVNATVKTIARSGMGSESIETVYGSVDGIDPDTTEELTEAQYDALVGNTLSPLHSNEHWDGTTITRG